MHILGLTLGGGVALLACLRADSMLFRHLLMHVKSMLIASDHPRNPRQSGVALGETLSPPWGVIYECTQIWQWRSHCPKSDSSVPTPLLSPADMVLAWSRFH
jgi:hypothetical protein